MSDAAGRGRDTVRMGDFHARNHTALSLEEGLELQDRHAKNRGAE
jgi:hypothetical protein